MCIAIVVLLCLSSILAVPIATSQNYTTITGLVTSTSYGLTTVGTSYITSVQQQRGLYSRTFVVNKVPSDPRCGCTYLEFPFTTNIGEKITGSFSSSASVSFYIINDIMFQRHGPSRFVITEETMLAQDVVTSFSIDLAMNSGRYHLIFMNWSKQNNANVNLDVSIVGGNTTITFTSFSYTSITLLQTLTSKGYSLIRENRQNLSDPMLWLPILVAVLAVASLLALIIRRKHSQK